MVISEPPAQPAPPASRASATIGDLVPLFAVLTDMHRFAV